MNFIYGYFICGIVFACLYDLLIRPVLPKDGYEDYFNKPSSRVVMSIMMAILWLPIVALNLYYGMVGKKWFYISILL